MRPMLFWNSIWVHMDTYRHRTQHLVLRCRQLNLKISPCRLSCEHRHSTHAETHIYTSKLGCLSLRADPSHYPDGGDLVPVTSIDEGNRIL